MGSSLDLRVLTADHRRTGNHSIRILKEIVVDWQDKKL